MESNGGKTKMSILGTSLAFQRAKEHENRTPDVEVMAETVSGSGLIRGVRVPGVWECGHPGWSEANSPGVRVPGGSRCGHPGVFGLGGNFGGNAKFRGFHGGKGGDCWGGARSTCQTSNPWTKTTKSHKIQQITRKNFGAIFVGIFEFGRKTTKSS